MNKDNKFDEYAYSQQLELQVLLKVGDKVEFNAPFYANKQTNIVSGIAEIIYVYNTCYNLKIEFLYESKETKIANEWNIYRKGDCVVIPKVSSYEFSSNHCIVRII